jgi:hypothetical protein
MPLSLIHLIVHNNIWKQVQRASTTSPHINFMIQSCNGLGLAQTYSSTSWGSSCTVMYICSSAHLR